jgi:hypothetical protein
MYLIHFNGNHSRKNGQFINGDGDNDGIVDDHHNYSRNKKDIVSQKTYVHPADVKDAAETLGKIARTGGILYLTFSKTGKLIKSEGTSLLNSGGILSAAKDAGVPQFIDRYKNMSYIKIADLMNRR